MAVSSLNGKTVNRIPWSIQNDIIMERSEFRWEFARHLNRYIDGCSDQQANQIYQLFDNLALLFRERLLKHKSEPRAIIFTISGKDKATLQKVDALLSIAQKAQLLYTRSGSAKDDGKREIYYIPNRILLPARGLDPLGQYARIQLKVSDILAAAEHNKPFPFVNSESITQPTLFDE